MNLGFELMSFVLTGGMAWAVAKTAFEWKGMFRDEMGLIAAGFGALCIAFFSEILAEMGAVQIGVAGVFTHLLFFIGVIPLVFGTSKIVMFVPATE